MLTNTQNLFDILCIKVPISSSVPKHDNDKLKLKPAVRYAVCASAAAAASLGAWRGTAGSATATTHQDSKLRACAKWYPL